METSRSVVFSRLRLQAADALRRARLLPVGPHRNDLRQLAIGLRALDLRERQEGRPDDLGHAALASAVLQAKAETQPGFPPATR